MNYLSIDYSTVSIGLTLKDEHGKYTFQNIKGKEGGLSAQVAKIKNFLLMNWIEETEPLTIVIEDQYSQVNPLTMKKLSFGAGYVCGAIEQFCNVAEIVKVYPQSWQSFHGIKGVRKERKKQSKALFEQMTSEKPVTDDISDSYLMLIYFENGRKKGKF